MGRDMGDDAQATMTTTPNTVAPKGPTGETSTRSTRMLLDICDGEDDMQGRPQPRNRRARSSEHPPLVNQRAVEDESVIANVPYYVTCVVSHLHTLRRADEGDPLKRARVLIVSLAARSCPLLALAVGRIVPMQLAT